MNVSCLTGITRNSGGVFYAVSALCKTLCNQQVNVSVYGREDTLVEADLPIWKPVSVIPYKGFGPLGTSFRLRRLLMNASIDLVHQHGLWMDDQWASSQWQKKGKGPVIISPHGMLDPWAVSHSAWKKKLVGKLFASESLRKAACIHALCESEANSIRKYGLENPIAIIPNGVVLPTLISDHGPPSSGEKRKLLFLGRIHTKKGLKELINAWGREPGAWRKDWTLIIAGWDDGNHLVSLKKYADELGLKWGDGGDSASLIFMGPVFGDDKDSLLRSVDGFVLPSFSEGLPMSVLEAWSYRLPVIMTEFCNIPEGFDAGAALRIEPNAESIARGLGQWSEMTEAERKSMGCHGRVLVEKKFTWKKIASDMKAVYEDCIVGRKPSF